MKKWAPVVLQNCSSTSNFFTKWTVAFQKWKATVHFVKIKKSISSVLTPPISHAISSKFFFSLLSFLPKIFLFFSFAFCSLLFLCSFGFLLKHKTGWFGGGLGLLAWWWLGLAGVVVVDGKTGWFSGWASLFRVIFCRSLSLLSSDVVVVNGFALPRSAWGGGWVCAAEIGLWWWVWVFEI